MRGLTPNYAPERGRALALVSCVIEILVCFFMTLRNQINLLITTLMILFISALLFLEVDASRRSIREEMEGSTRITVQLLGTMMHDVVSNGQAVTPKLLVEFMNRVGRVRAHDIALYNAADLLVYKSPPFQYKAGHYAPLWFAEWVTPQASPVSIEFPGGHMVIAPDASRSVVDAWDELQKILWLVLAFFVLVNAVLYVIVGRALAPLRDLILGLEQMERKEFHTRLPNWRMREMALLGRAFNRMAQAVEESFLIKKAAARTAQELQDSREVSALIQSHLEDERRNLARELHDELGQSVTAVRTIATTIAQQSAATHPEMTERAQAIVSVSGTMYDAMHRMVRQLRPLALDNLGLSEALNDLVRTHRNLYPEHHLLITLVGDLEALPDFLRITVYRVVQECLTNTVRHAEAETIEVTVTAQPQELTIRVADDGRGMALGEMKDNRFGVLGMRERVQALGGRFDVTSTPGQGFCVEVCLPLGGPS